MLHGINWSQKCLLPIPIMYLLTRGTIKFIFNGILYIPLYTWQNGLSCSPQVFTKILKTVYATAQPRVTLMILRGHLQSLSALILMLKQRLWLVTASLHKRVGFHLYPTKSVVIPTQHFLGFVLDSNDMTATNNWQQNPEVNYSLSIGWQKEIVLKQKLQKRLAS